MKYAIYEVMGIYICRLENGKQEGRDEIGRRDKEDVGVRWKRTGRIKKLAKKVPKLGQLQNVTARIERNQKNPSDEVNGVTVKEETRKLKRGSEDRIRQEHRVSPSARA
ncbi:hypothetical protein BDR04DRAFT_1101065 [Suillus decipiens]|nr:hypothetical protein BDR04DRAFT_1101065 [Suillus decipiens]